MEVLLRICGGQSSDCSSELGKMYPFLGEPTLGSGCFCSVSMATEGSDATDDFSVTDIASSDGREVWMMIVTNSLWHVLYLQEEGVALCAGGHAHPTHTSEGHAPLGRGPTTPHEQSPHARHNRTYI